MELDSDTHRWVHALRDTEKGTKPYAKIYKQLLYHLARDSSEYRVYYQRWVEEQACRTKINELKQALSWAKETECRAIRARKAAEKRLHLHYDPRTQQAVNQCTCMKKWVT